MDRREGIANAGRAGDPHARSEHQVHRCRGTHAQHPSAEDRCDAAVAEDQRREEHAGDDSTADVTHRRG